MVELKYPAYVHNIKPKEEMMPNKDSWEEVPNLMSMHAILHERKKYAKPSTSKSIPSIFVEIEDNSFESNVDK